MEVVAPARAGEGRREDGDEMLLRVARALSRANGYFTVLVDAGLTVKWASETTEAVLGWPDVVGANVLGMIHPDDVDLALRGILHHTNNAEAYDELHLASRLEPVTVRLQHADGSFVPVQVTLVNHLNDPEVGGLLGICHRVVDPSDRELVLDLLGRGAPIEDVLPVIARYVDRTSDGRRCQIVWWENGDGRIVAAPEGEPLPPTPWDLVAETMATREAQQHLRSDSPSDLVEDLFSSGQSALWLAPIVAHDRRGVLGVLLVWGEVEFDLVLKQTDNPAIRLAALALTDHRSKSSLRWEATHDALTRVRNRSGFASAMTAISEPCALLYLDLDDFKPVNDTFGHESGDRVLVRVAERISRAVREIDIVARLGGDEFAVICPGATAGDAQEIARRLSRAVTRPMRIAGEPVKVGVSVGIAAATQPGDRAGLLRRADEALYQAKFGGKRRIAIAG